MYISVCVYMCVRVRVCVNVYHLYNITLNLQICPL